MDSKSPKVVFDDIGSAIGHAAAKAKAVLILVAPFITRPALERVITNLDPIVSLLVYTRWRPEEIAAGVSDLSIFDLLQERPHSRLLLQPRLHAKLYVIDDDIAFVGSANITEPGLGYSPVPNVEAVVQIEPVPTSLFLFLRRLEKTSVAASAELRQKIERAVQALTLNIESSSVDTLISDPPSASSSANNIPFPTLRVPERLYEGYRSLQTFRTREEREALLDDLLRLSLPDEMDEEKFRNEVGRKLLTFPEIFEFDSFIVQPRRFGEVTDWLKRRDPGTTPDHKECQRRAQTFIRWLRFFLPGRYRLSTPRYSEIFGRSDTWPRDAE